MPEVTINEYERKEGREYVLMIGKDKVVNNPTVVKVLTISNKLLQEVMNCDSNEVQEKIYNIIHNL